MAKYLVTIQAWVHTDSASQAENIASETADYIGEANEDPGATYTEIQTCVAQKAPFRPLDPTAPFWAGACVDDDIEAEGQ